MTVTPIALTDLNPQTGIRDTNPNRVMLILRARCVARYRLRSVPGRPEELVTIAGQELGVSFGYTHRVIRVRQHGGPRNREWIDARDIQIKDGWLDEAQAFLDPFFGFIPEKLIRAPR